MHCTQQKHFVYEDDSRGPEDWAADLLRDGRVDQRIVEGGCVGLLIVRMAFESLGWGLIWPEQPQGGGQRFSYVETDFLRALKNGYVVEIQEPTTIVQPGVLVGLNSLLEQGGSITLPTGEIIRRHPDAVVVVTTNVSYEGCRGMNQ